VNHRKVPLKSLFGTGGTCRWCGGSITYPPAHKRGGYLDKRRGWHDGRNDEANCLKEYFLHSDHSAQYKHLKERDGEDCWECKGRPLVWSRDTPCTRWRDPTGVYVGQYTPVWWGKADLEVEHTVPLWSVAHLPDDERRPYFGPTNLRLMCVPCHKRKSAKEAKQRAETKKARPSEDVSGPSLP
jgi:hypothetical protein